MIFVTHRFCHGRFEMAFTEAAGEDEMIDLVFDDDAGDSHQLTFEEAAELISTIQAAVDDRRARTLMVEQQQPKVNSLP